VRFWHLAVLWLLLFGVALASEIELLSYLSYLLLFAGVAMGSSLD